MTVTKITQPPKPTRWQAATVVSIREETPRVKTELLDRIGGMADCFVCGRDGFVEAASVLLMQAGQPSESIRTERFGATGPLPH